MSTPSDRNAAASRAGAPPRSLASLAGRLGPVKLVRAVLYAPVRFVNAGQDVLHATEQLPALVARIRAVVDTADALLCRVGTVTTRADAAVGIVDAWTNPDAAFASQAAQLLARTGPLLDQVDAVVMPLLKEMRGAVPDVRDILPVVQRLEPVMVDVETRIAGLPGAARLRKRGEREIADAAPDCATS